MTALTADAPLMFLGPVYTEKWPLTLDVYPISLFKGAPIIIDVSTDDQGIVPADGITMASGDVFAGIAAERGVSAVGQVEPTRIEVFVWPTIVGFPTTSFDLGDLGKSISMSDSGTLTLTPGTYPVIGSIYTIRSGYCYVLLEAPYVR